MVETSGRADNRGVRRVATVVVPSLFTAAAFAVLSHFHVVGDLPLGVLLALLVVVSVSGELTGGLIRRDGSALALHAALAAQVLDVTTTIRHHPVEALVQALCDAALALLFGFSPQAVLLYGGVVLVAQTFHHGNVMLPVQLRPLSRLLITPDLHRLHHSMAYAENNSNFGNLIPLWDWLFGTLRQTPQGEFQIGLYEFASADFQRLDKLLIQPLRVTPARGLEPEHSAAG